MPKCLYMGCNDVTEIITKAQIPLGPPRYVTTHTTRTCDNREAVILI